MSMRFQRGITLGGMMRFCVFAAVLAVVGMKLFPVFSEGFKVKSSMNYVAKQPGAESMTLTDVSKAMAKNLQINGVSNNGMDDALVLIKLIKIAKTPKGPEMTLPYDISAPIMDNPFGMGKLDAVLHFSYTVILGGKGPKE